MGIDVHLQDERGTDLRVVPDSEMILSRLVLHSPEIENTICLRFVMPYANTTFNQAQLPVLLSELGALRPSLDAKSLAFVDSVISLAKEANLEPHLYVKFIGD